MIKEWVIVILWKNGVVFLCCELYFGCGSCNVCIGCGSYFLNELGLELEY